jgi:hypothetical protein
MHGTHGCADFLHEVFYLAMQTTRWIATIYCAILLSFSACGGSDGGEPKETATPASIAVVQVETVTTVQSSAGSFLSPSPEQVVPAFVERSESSAVGAALQSERAKVDVALLFRGNEAESFTQPVDAQLTSASSAQWSAIEHCFPAAERAAARVHWPLSVSSLPLPDLDNTVSPEWRGWQDFRGLGVRSSARGSDLSVPVATLDFETNGPSSPLVLSAQGDTLLVTNRSAHAIARALLIYSHSGGVGVTALQALAPGEQRVTVLGPKEHSPGALLQLAREQLTEFFSASVGAELAPALTAAKSIPFLEAHGLRLVALLDEAEEPATVSFSPAVSAQQRVVISHSEILKPEEEARVVRVVMDPSVDLELARASFGRFTQAKLEFAMQSADSSASERATILLSELRSR